MKKSNRKVDLIIIIILTLIVLAVILMIVLSLTFMEQTQELKGNDGNRL